MNSVKKWTILPAALFGMLGLGGIIHNNIHADTIPQQSQAQQSTTPAQSSNALQHAESDIQYQANVLHTQLIASQMHKIFNEPQATRPTAPKASIAETLPSKHVSSTSSISSAPSSSTSSSPVNLKKSTNATTSNINRAPELLNTSNVESPTVPDGTDIAQKYSHGKVGWHADLYDNGTVMTLTGDFAKYKPRYVSNGHSVGNWYPNEEYDGYSGLLGNDLPVSDVDKILGRIRIVRLGNASNLYTLQAMFSNMPKLWSVVKVGHFDTAFVSDMADAFHGDKSLANISALSDWYTGRVTDMQNMFQSDDSLSDLSPLSHWDTHSVQEMDSMFAGSSDSDNNALYNLQPLTRWDTSHVLSMGQMFANDLALSDITPLANWDTDSVDAMVNMFQSDSINQSPNWRPHHIMSIPANSDTEDKTWRAPSDNTNPAHRKIVSDVINYHNLPFTQRGLQGSNGQSLLTANGKLYNFVYNGSWHNIDSTHGGGTKPPVTPGAASVESDQPKGTKLPMQPTPAYDPQLNLYIDTIQYTYQGKQVGTAKVAGYKGSSFTVGANPSNLQAKYKVVNPQQSFQYTGLTHNIPVELNEAAPVTMSLSNQNNITVGYVTLKKLGLVGQRVNIEPYLIKMMPKGYHLPANNPIYITLSNGSSIVINA